MKILFFYSLLGLMLLSKAATSQTQPKTNTSLKAAWATTKKTLLEASSQVPSMGGTFALIENGKIIGQYNFGYADREQKVKVRNQTLFPMGSISKLITALAIFQLQEQGKLKLSDPVTKYIPELKKAPQDFGGFDSVKIHHLINHTTNYDRGLALYLQFEKENPRFKEKESYCFDDLKPYFHLFKFTGKPGEKHLYSNWGYSFLGIIVERASGLKYQRYIHKKILKPLGMTNAYFGATNKKRKKYLAKCYTVDSNRVISKGQQPTYNQCFGEANGGLKSTVSDMLKLMIFFTGSRSKLERSRYNQVLKRATINEYFTINDESIKDSKKLVYTHKYKTYKRGKLSCLTFVSFGDVSQSYLGHDGYIYDYKSACYWRKRKNIGIIWTSNTVGPKNSDEYVFGQILIVLQNALLSKQMIQYRTWEDYLKVLKIKRK